MQLVAVIVCATFAESCRAVDLPPFPADAAQIIAPIHQAYADVEARQAALPAATSDGERLERLLEFDQAGREVLVRMDFTQLPEGERKGAQTTAWQEIIAHDRANQQQLKAMLPPAGWFTESVYGAKAAAEPERLDERRRAVGLPETEDEYLLHFRNRPCL